MNSKQQTAVSKQQTANSSKQKQVPSFLRFSLLLIAYCLLLPLASGCVYRALTIRTDPPGAMVYVNDVLKGESPVTYDFQWYGWHRVMIRKNGYQRVDDRKKLRAPPYLWIPFDLAMELLPFPIRDQRTLAYALTPQAAPAEPIPPALFTQPKPQANPEPVAPAASMPLVGDSASSRASEASRGTASIGVSAEVAQPENQEATP